MGGALPGRDCGTPTHTCPSNAHGENPNANRDEGGSPSVFSINRNCTDWNPDAGYNAERKDLEKGGGG